MQNVRKFIRDLSVYIGPGYLVAVGYLDPGNWATDLAAGSSFGYTLLFVVFLSNLMAILLQSLAIRLGVVANMDLAQACSKYVRYPFNIILYLLAEIAIIATDLAEVIGSAIALNLLFGIPLTWGVVITIIDVMLILIFWNGKHGKVFELMIICLVLATAICLFILVGMSNVNYLQALIGYLPTPRILTAPGSLVVAVGIIGATVMPHNLFLHSNLVKRNVSESIQSKSSLLKSLRMINTDSVVALTLALFVNSAILIIAASNFADGSVSSLKSAFELLTVTLGKAAGIIFALGLLFAGQSSTITGTIAGQIITEGFLGDLQGYSFLLRPWVRLMVIRSLAILPALICVVIYGESGLNSLLIWSQVILSFQLPFCLWPLIYFTTFKASIMTVIVHDDLKPQSVQMASLNDEETPVLVSDSGIGQFNPSAYFFCRQPNNISFSCNRRTDNHST